MIKKLLPILIIFLQLKAHSTPNKIRLYAIYTASHELLLREWFLPSLKDNYELILELHNQISPDGASSTDQFNQTVIKKTDLAIKAIHDNWGQFFIFSDVDIQFFQPTQPILLSLLKDNDLLIQKGDPYGGICTGFFVCRANEKTLKLWSKIQKHMLNHPETGDQEAMEMFIRDTNPFSINWDYLPNSFYGSGIIQREFWYPGDELNFPEENLILHHATCTRGVNNKIEQLAYVKQVVSDRQHYENSPSIHSD